MSGREIIITSDVLFIITIIKQKERIVYTSQVVIFWYHDNELLTGREDEERYSKPCLMKNEHNMSRKNHKKIRQKSLNTKMQINIVETIKITILRFGRRSFCWSN